MMRVYSALSFLVVGVLLTTVGGCAKDYSTGSYDGGSSTPPAPNTIVLSGYSFSPATLTISAGTMITWENRDNYVHTSTSDNGVWDTGDIPGGSSKTTAFNTPGTFPYHCRYHRTMGMIGTIIVQ